MEFYKMIGSVYSPLFPLRRERGRGIGVKRSKTRRAPMSVLLVLLLFAILLAGCTKSDGSKPPTATPLPGTVLDPPREVRDFTLTSHTGEPLSLHDLRGKVVLMFFGYTNCPDVCPTTLAEFKRVKTELGDEAQNVAFVFVSVDGARDTPERLAAYVAAFDPDFIGLTGEDVTLRTIGKDYGLFYQRVNYDSAQEGNYLVDHTASSFALDAEGRLSIIFPYQTDPAIMAQRIRSIM
ncbi:MAG: SCO family protein [Chloroflexi bacterium]|nr:SCO family protein [Chloroflexota bacterium]